MGDLYNAILCKMYNNQTTSAWISYLAFGAMPVTNESLERDMRSLSETRIMSIATNWAWNVINESTVTDMTTLRNFEVSVNKFYVDKIFI
jgi:hypothetical protein